LGSLPVNPCNFQLVKLCFGQMDFLPVILATLPSVIPEINKNALGINNVILGSLWNFCGPYSLII